MRYGTLKVHVLGVMWMPMAPGATTYAPGFFDVDNVRGCGTG